MQAPLVQDTAREQSTCDAEGDVPARAQHVLGLQGGATRRDVLRR